MVIDTYRVGVNGSCILDMSVHTSSRASVGNYPVRVVVVSRWHSGAGYSQKWESVI